MARWLAMAAAVLQLTLVTGCDRGQTPTAPGVEDAASPSRLKIGVSIPAADHGWTAGVAYWARHAMDQYPDVEWVFATAVSPDKQISDIEDMMAQGVEGLVVLATESAPLTPVARQAAARGIYIVNVDRGFLEPVAHVLLEGDNKAFGRKAAQFIVEKLGGDGKVAVLRGIPSTVDTDRFEAASAVFASHPKIEVLAAQPGMWNRNTALQVMQSYLTQFPRIDAVWASDDDMALGVEQAIREAGRSGEMFIVGGGGMKDVVQKIMANDPMYPATVTYPPAMIAAGVHVAVAKLRGQGMDAAAAKMPPHLHLDAAALEGDRRQGHQTHVTIDVHLVTPANAAEFYFPESVY